VSAGFASAQKSGDISGSGDQGKRTPFEENRKVPIQNPGGKILFGSALKRRKKKDEHDPRSGGGQQQGVVRG